MNLVTLAHPVQSACLVEMEMLGHKDRSEVLASEARLALEEKRVTLVQLGHLEALAYLD